MGNDDDNEMTDSPYKNDVSDDELFITIVDSYGDEKEVSLRDTRDIVVGALSRLEMYDGDMYDFSVALAMVFEEIIPVLHEHYGWEADDFVNQIYENLGQRKQ